MKFKKHKDISRSLEKLLRDSKKRDFLIKQAKAVDTEHKLTDEQIESLLDNILKGVPNE